MKARSLAAQAAQFFFPQRYCLLCGAFSGKPGLCEACAAQTAALARCDLCGAFLPAPGVCGHCADSRPLFAQALAVAPYAGKLRESLLAFKYQEQTWLRRPLAALLAHTYEQFYHDLPFQAVIPVPLSHQRIKERGYNQSQMLSAQLAAEFALPHRPNLLKRVADTPPLASYDGAHRSALLQNSFSATKVEGQTILLVDDIYTSGATLNACSAVLLMAGARSVYGLTVAGYDERMKNEAKGKEFAS